MVWPEGKRAKGLEPGPWWRTGVWATYFRLLTWLVLSPGYAASIRQPMAVAPLEGLVEFSS